MMLAAQYTVLKDIHGGHRNWQELLGVVLVILSSMMAALINTYCKTQEETQEGTSIPLNTHCITQQDKEEGSTVLGEEGIK